jgi:hypothetical protein
MDDNEIESRFVRLSAYVCALEDLLVALVNTMPNRAEVVDIVLREGETFDAVACQEPFTDEALEAFQEARSRVLALISKTPN